VRPRTGALVDQRTSGLSRRELLAGAVAAGAVLTMAEATEGATDGSLAGQIADLTRGFQGTVVLYARNLATGADFGLEPDAKVRTASTIKLPILCALESLIAKGSVKWDEQMRVTPDSKVSGSGVLASLEDGTEVSIRNLAILMIVLSDNTATNLILDRIGGDTVNDYIDAIGLRATRVNRKIRGDGPALKEASGWTRAGTVEENRKYGIGVSTPREMVQLLGMLNEGRIVSAEASKDVIEIMKKQQDKDGIGRHADVDVASKSGALDALRSDVGLVFTTPGPLAIAITVDGMPEVNYAADNVGKKLIWDISNVLIEELEKK
jgi:beta-lactamase class A